MLNPEALVKEAKASKHREVYRTLDSSLSYRIGVSVRFDFSENYSFFIEVLFYLCPASGSVDLETLDKCLACLKELEKRGYCLTCQDGECISCEATVPIERVSEEYFAVRSLIANILNP